MTPCLASPRTPKSALASGAAATRHRRLQSDLRLRVPGPGPGAVAAQHTLALGFQSASPLPLGHQPIITTIVPLLDGLTSGHQQLIAHGPIDAELRGPVEQSMGVLTAELPPQKIGNVDFA
jgi:hypothetical protein